MYKCPKGCESNDVVFCSECGVAMNPVAINLNIDNHNSNINSISNNNVIYGECPDCNTPRVENARFCEVCKYDYLSKKSFSSSDILKSCNESSKSCDISTLESVSKSVIEDNLELVSESVLESMPVFVLEQTTESASRSISSIQPALKLNVIITSDKSLIEDDEVKARFKDTKERMFPLDLDENLVGRRSTNRNIYPEIELNDPGVSHRHLKILKQSDGSYSILELGSSNGTILNQEQLDPHVLTPIKVGDELIIGAWTRLKIEAR